MEKFILEEGNNYYFKSWSILETNASINKVLLEAAENTTRPTRFSSSTYGTLKTGLENLGFECNVIKKSTKEKPIEDYFVFNGYIGNY